MDPAKAIAGALFFFSGLCLGVVLPFKVAAEDWIWLVPFGLLSILLMYAGAKAWASAVNNMNKEDDLE